MANKWKCPNCGEPNFERKNKTQIVIFLILFLFYGSLALLFPPFMAIPVYFLIFHTFYSLRVCVRCGHADKTEKLPLY
jgi:hypothetical protein